MPTASLVKSSTTVRHLNLLERIEDEVHRPDLVRRARQAQAFALHRDTVATPPLLHHQPGSPVQAIKPRVGVRHTAAACVGADSQSVDTPGPAPPTGLAARCFARRYAAGNAEPSGTDHPTILNHQRISHATLIAKNDTPNIASRKSAKKHYTFLKIKKLHKDAT